MFRISGSQVLSVVFVFGADRAFENPATSGVAFEAPRTFTAAYAATAAQMRAETRSIFLNKNSL